MLILPKSTQFNKRIPKQKFYEKIDIQPALKKSFIQQIKTIYWRNKIAATTVNLAAGSDVTEIEVLLITLSSPILDEGILWQIDRQIPYHILFLLEYQSKYQAWIGYKESAQSGKAAFKVGSYYHTDWLAEEELPLQMQGRTLDAVYENFVRQIAGDILSPNKPGENLKAAVEREEKRQLLQKQIAQLTAKIQKEKQFNKQVELNSILKKLKKEMEHLS